MQHVNSWRDVAAATGAADRAAAEEGVRRAYRTAGLAEPERIVWAPSPRAAVEAVEKLADAGRSVREEVRTRPWAEERRRMYDELGPAGWSALWSATGAQLWRPRPRSPSAYGRGSSPIWRRGRRTRARCGWCCSTRCSGSTTPPGWPPSRGAATASPVWRR